jgi:hypothetical protein
MMAIHLCLVPDAGFGHDCLAGGALTADSQG